MNARFNKLEILSKELSQQIDKLKDEIKKPIYQNRKVNPKTEEFTTSTDMMYEGSDIKETVVEPSPPR